MASLNKVILIGNLTRDPELRYTPNGTPVATFGLAVNRKFKDKEDVTYVTIVVWSKLAELCGDYISKGSPVAIDGRLQSRSWETEDGSKRSVLEVVAENVQFLGRKPDSRETAGNEGASRDEGLEEIESVLEEDIPF